VAVAVAVAVTVAVTTGGVLGTSPNCLSPPQVLLLLLHLALPLAGRVWH
jgi:hypothetical protein